MYAVIKTGGKQYKVCEGDSLRVEKIAAEQGATVEFEPLLVANEDDVKIGAPIVEGAKVSAEIVSHGRGEKIRIVKFRRRKHHRKQMGHRQDYTELKITAINAG